MQRISSLLAKVAISALLLYFSLRNVEFDGIRQGLTQLDIRWLPLVFSALFAQTLLLAARWRDIITACRTKLPLAKAISYNFMGQFFSQVLPSTVGGDVVRIWLLARSGAGMTPAVHSVLLDRLLGISALAIFVVACLPWTIHIVHDPIACAALAFIGFGTLAAALAFLGIGLIPLRLMDRWWLTRHLAVASRAALRLCRSAYGARAAAVSFPIHLLTVTAAWGAAMAAHSSVDFLYILFLVLPVMLIATVPVSIAGWGVRESAMIAAFSYAGLAANDALIISVILGFVGLAVGVIGGIFWIANGYQLRSVEKINSAKIIPLSAS